MANYDFGILSPAEFEELSRDLLQKRLDIFIESFTSGRDGGIDLRASVNPTSKIIIQAKRHKTWSELRSILAKEAAKVTKLNPSRYILTTSVGLTPANKDDINAIFSPYIQDTADIYGRDDLNNLLEIYGDVEKSHYKLWLSSTAVLQRILHCDAVNWTDFELNEIKRQVSMYVMNNSFNEALRILRANHFVIISGIPGIGKTTLAQMLAYDLLAHGYDEFHFIPGDIDNATKAFQQGRKQVFFFDDFLGATALDNLNTGFIRKLLMLIREIRNDSTKALILTTREYILKEGLVQYEKLAQENVEIAKCILDIGSYTKKIRAQILYNHLYAAGLPEEYIQDFLKDRRYHRILNHANFNPRIIEVFIDKSQWRSVKPGDFMSTFINLFEHPDAVWRMAFEQLGQEARYALLILITMGSAVTLDDWRTAYLHFSSTAGSRLKLKTDEFSWKSAIKILSDCFIKTTKASEQLIATPFNPSVRDFVIMLIQESVELQRELIEGSYFYEQLISVFGKRDPLRATFLGKVDIDSSLWPMVRDKFLEHIADGTRRTCGIISFRTILIRSTPIPSLFATLFIRQYAPWDTESDRLISTEVLRLVQNTSRIFAASILDLIKWFKWPESREILQVMKTEHIIVDHYPAMLETMQETGNSDLIFDSAFHEFMDEALAKQASAHVRNQMEYDELDSTVHSIATFLPDDVTLPNATHALAEAHERIASNLEFNIQNSTFNIATDLDPDDSPTAIDREIDHLMDGLLTQ